jgi:hypothetical protein
MQTVIFKYQSLELIFHQVKNVCVHIHINELHFFETHQVYLSYHVHLAEVQLGLVCAS